MCVCNHIELYIKKTEVIRQKETQLLISYIKPHKAISTSTVSRWVMSMLSAAGIDTKTFKTFPKPKLFTRSASSSKAKVQGVPIKDILKRGSWSNSSTFERFYSREILPEGSNFQACLYKGFEERQ